MTHEFNFIIPRDSIMAKALGIDEELLKSPTVHEYSIESEDVVQEFVVQITPAKAWAIVKSILFQLEHDADFIEIAIVSKPEDVKR